MAVTRYVLMIWGVALLHATGGCAADECSAASEKLAEECGLGGGAFSIDSQIVECLDETACRAQCVLEFDCEDITAEDEAGDEYRKCVAECND